MSWDNKGPMNTIDDIDDVVIEEHEIFIYKGKFIISLVPHSRWYEHFATSKQKN